MSKVAEKLKSELVQLSTRDRAELAHFLICSLDQDADEDAEGAWDAELARRLRDIKSGKAIGDPANEVFAELREKYS